MALRTLRSPALAAALLPLVLLAACGDDNGGSDGGDNSGGASSPTEETSPESDSTEESPEETATEAGQCAYPEGGETAREVDPPPSDPTARGKVRVTISTDRGKIPAELNAKAAPCTVNSFLSLAEQNFFADTHCHRMADSPGFGILQCGDPSGTGQGGPGYTFDDELSGDESYPAGTLAMANSGPDTNGSQFFIVFKDTEISPQYTTFGRVGPQGLKTVRKVARAGVEAAEGPGDGTGPPKRPITITSVDR